MSEQGMLVADGIHPIPASQAATLVVAYHYLHRRPPISYAYGLVKSTRVVGVCTFGIPASRHLQKSACPTDPDLVVELNRLWVEDSQPRNTESTLIAACLKRLPARIVVSYADLAHGHVGYVYRATNWRYAGWTDMERKTPRFDYVPTDPTKHSRDAYRGAGWSTRVPRVPKVRYWTTTGNRSDRRRLTGICDWPSLDWRTTPPPMVGSAA